MSELTDNKKNTKYYNDTKMSKVRNNNINQILNCFLN